MRVPHAHAIDHAAQALLARELPHSWVRSTPGDDYGLDYYVDAVESLSLTGIRFGIQLKGIEKPAIVGSCIHFPFPTKNLGTYLTAEPLPVLLVVADVKSEKAYFLFLQRYADEELEDEAWADQQTVTVNVPLENRVADHPRLRSAIIEAHEYVLAARAAPDMILRRRSEALQRLDRRFIVSATATEHGTTYELEPKEDVTFGIRFSGLDEARRSALRRGYVVPVERGELSFRDAPIFTRLQHAISSVQLASVEECTATIEIEQDGLVAALINVPATVTAGVDEMRVVARYANAPFDAKATLTFLPPRESLTASARIDLQQTIDDRWFGRPIDALPHFDRMYQFTKVRRPYQFRLILHPPGDEDFELPWGGPIGASGARPDAYATTLEQLWRAREVCRLLNLKPILPATDLSTALENVDTLYDLLTEDGHEKDAPRGVFSGSASEWSDYTASFAKAKGRPTDFWVDLPDGLWRCRLLGLDVAVPAARAGLTKARCKMTKRPDGTVGIRVEGTPKSRFWVEKHRTPSNRGVATSAGT